MLYVRALTVLQAHPGEYLTAAEVVLEAEGHVAGLSEERHYERALLLLVDSDYAFPRQPPRGARSYCLRVDEVKDARPEARTG